MKLSVLQENLTKGLDTVSRAVSTRSTLPVLANVLIRTTEDGKLELAATNLEVAISCRVGAMISDGGAITLPSRTLTDLVRSLPKERVEFTLNDNTQTVKLECARSKTNIKGIDHLEFPLVPEPGDTVATFDSATLKAAINQVVVAAADNDARPVLAGVLFESNGTIVSLAATDGFRLHLRTFEHVGTAFRVVVPGKALAEVARLIEGDVNVSFPVHGKQIIFDCGHVTIASQLIDGQFPSYEPVIPSRWDTKILLDTQSLRLACRTVDIFAREANNIVALSVSDGSTKLEAVSSETGDNAVSLDAEFNGKGLDINFNVRYLAQSISAIGTVKTVIQATKPNEPIVIKPESGDFLAVLMPMQQAGR